MNDNLVYGRPQRYRLQLLLPDMCLVLIPTQSESMFATSLTRL